MRLSARVAIALCLALLLGLSLSYASLLRSGNAGPRQTDFVAYYTGARLAGQGHAGRLYSIDAVGRAETALVFPLRMRDGSLPYVYPPFFALALSPLSALSYTAAFAVWIILNFCALAWVFARLKPYAGLGRTGTTLLVLASLSWLPVFAALTQGQTSILMLATLCSVLLALRANREDLGGAMLALALIKPPMVAPLVLTLALQRRFRALRGFAAGAAALFVVPTILFGLKVDAGYLGMLSRATRWHTQFGYNPPWNQSFAGEAQLLLPAGAASAATAALALVALALLAHVTWRWREIDVPFALAVVVGLLVSPHVLIHDLALLILPAAAALRLRRAGPGGLGALLACGSLAVLVGARLAFSLPIQLSVAVMLLLALWLARVQPPDARDTATTHTVRPAPQEALP